MHCINRGRSHSPGLMPFLRHLIWISACDQFILTAKHIPRSKNQIADTLSHFAFQIFRLLTPEAGPSPMPVPASSKRLQASFVKGYLSGVQFFNKLIFSSPSAAIASSQISTLIKGIQRSQPTCLEARQLITLEILTGWISTLRQGYHSKHVDRTLKAMFVLPFFSFLRSSEIYNTS